MNAAELSSVPIWGPPVGVPDEESSAFAVMLLQVLSTLPPNDPIRVMHSSVVSSEPIPELVVAQYLDRLNSLAATGHAWKAWATVNIALPIAVHQCHLGLVETLLHSPQWQLCKQSPVLQAAIGNDKCSKLLRLLLADARFQESSLLSRHTTHLIRRVGTDTDGRVGNALRMLLSIPQFPPGIVWDSALARATRFAFHPDTHKFHLPRVFALKDVMEVAEWQFERARIQRKVVTWMCPGPWRWRQRPWLCLLPPAPALPSSLLHLPIDIQYMLHNFLDLSSLHSLRLTCRALQHFPVDRFARRRVENALQYLSTNDLAVYESPQIQQLVESVPNRAGPSVMEYRALVEAVRNLDVELALKFLCPQPGDIAKGYDLCRAPHPELIDYVISWALFVLLKRLATFLSSKPKQDVRQARFQKGGVLLEALLAHPLLHSDVWSLILFHFDAARTALVAAASVPDSRSRIAEHRASDPSAAAATATAQYLTQLICTGTLADPIPPCILAELETANLDYSSMSTPTRAFMFLATLSYKPSTFVRLMTLLPSPPPDQIKSALLSIVCRRPHPTKYFSHVASSLAPIPASLLQAPIAGRIALCAKRAVNSDLVAQFLPHLDLHSVHALVFPMMATCSGQADIHLEALVLTHWLRMVAGGEPWTDGRIKRRWEAVSMLTQSLTTALRDLRAGGDQVAGERMRELNEAWVPVRKEWIKQCPEFAGWRDKCLIQ